MITRQRPVVLIVVVVAAVAGALAWLLWPSGSHGPTVLEAGTEHYTVRLSVNNPRMGLNSLGVEVTDLQGNPASLDAVAVEPVMPQMGHALAPVPATPNGPGRYRAVNVMLPMSGQWEITVVLDHAGQVVFPLLVKG